MKPTKEPEDAVVLNSPQPNTRSRQHMMREDFGTAPVSENVFQEDLEDEFDRETCLVFEFDNREEKDAVLKQLEGMLLGTKSDSTKGPAERMNKLAELFKDCIFENEWSIVHNDPPDGAVTAFRGGKLPSQSFNKDDIPGIFVKEVARITGIEVPVEEAKISWDICTHMNADDYPEVREYFLDNGVLCWFYVPKTHIPGQRWRLPISQTSHEISAVLQRIKNYKEGYLTVEERLIRWGLVMHISSKIQEFKHDYSKDPEEWSRVLGVLDVREEDIRVMDEFVNKMPSLNPVSDLIPIRVLEVITVFRVLFRLSLRQFELAYDG